MPAEAGERAESVLIVSLDDPWKGGGIGGKHTHIRLLKKGLEGLGAEVSIATVKEGLAFKVLHGLPGGIYRELALRRTDERYVHYVGQRVKVLREAVERAKGPFSAVNAHDVLSAEVVLASGRFKEVPLVLTLHGYFSSEAASDGELVADGPTFKRYIETERKVYTEASRIICVDTRIAKHVKSLAGVMDEKVVVVPNAVEVERFAAPAGTANGVFKDAIRVPRGSFVVLCPRRLVPKNGVPVAVRAMAGVAREVPEAVLLVAGDGPDRDRVLEAIREDDLSRNVILLGPVPHSQMPLFYGAADVVVIPSVLSEGVEEATSLSMLEGMAAKRAVVVTDVGGLKETVRDGVTGIIVRQNDPRALASAMVKLYKDAALARKLAQAGFEYVKANHSYQEHARRVLAEFGKAKGR